MPSLVEKVFKLSSTRKTHAFKASARAKRISYAKTTLINFASYLNPLLGDQETDMPGSRKTRDRKPREPEDDKPKSSKGSSKKPIPTSNKSSITVTSIEEPGAKSRNKSSSSRDKPAAKDQGSQAEKQRACALSRSSEAAPASSQVQNQNFLAGDSAPYLDRQVNAELRYRKKQIVDRLMAVVLDCLEKKLEPFEEPCDGEGCSSRTHGSSSGLMLGQSTRQSIGKKRQLQRDDPDGNDSGGDDRRRSPRNPKRMKKDSEEKKPKYACPYYKYDPARFKNVRTCCGPGWDELHRVKEHLARSHALPRYECRRCHESFKKEEDLDKHSQSDEACKVRDQKHAKRDLADGFNKDQEEKLLKRTRNKPGHDKWIEWYCILFETEPGSADLPSPFYDDSDWSNCRDKHTGRSNYQPYLDYLRREIPPRIRNQIEIEVDKALDGVELSIKSNVIEKINSITSTIHCIFEGIPPPPGSILEDDNGSAVDNDDVIPPGFDPTRLFDDLDPILEPGDAFDFATLEPGTLELVYEEDSSASSYFSDRFHGEANSSNTSVDGQHHPKESNYVEQEYIAPQEQFTLPPQDPSRVCCQY